MYVDFKGWDLGDWVWIFFFLENLNLLNFNEKSY